MDECCDICGSVGVPDALVTCSQCKASLQHMYCMKARFLEYPDDWCCEECEPSSKQTFSRLANCEPSSKPTFSQLANCSEVRKGAARPSKIRKLLNESKQGPFNWEKKVATRKTEYISINEVIKLPSGAMDFSPRSKVTSHSSTSQPPTREVKPCFSQKNSAFDVRRTSSPVHSMSTPCVSPSQEVQIPNKSRQPSQGLAKHIQKEQPAELILPQRKVKSMMKNDATASSPGLPRVITASEMLSKKEKIDDFDKGHRKSGKECFSRCSTTIFRDVMKLLLPKLGDRQRQRISNTLLAKWLEMPKLAIFSTRVDFILKRFDAVKFSFRFGSNLNVPFTAAEFSIVLGLPQGGQPVDMNLNLRSDLLDRYFQGKRSIGDRDAISTKLLELADKETEEDVDDFVRFFILFAFNCVVFPVSNYCTPQCIWCYLDDLDTFFDYSWGDAAYRFLLDDILDHLGGSKKKVSKTYVDGCLVGLMAWVYEHVPVLGKARSIRCFPRMFKWEDSKIPLKAKAAESLLQSITSTKIVWIRPFPQEKKLLVADNYSSSPVNTLMNETEMMSHMRRLENGLTLLKGKHSAELDCSKTEKVDIHMDQNVDDGGQKVNLDKNCDDVGEKVEEDQNLNVKDENADVEVR